MTRQAGSTYTLDIGAVAGFGVAVAGGVLGAVFIGKSNETSSQADALCNPTCRVEDENAISSLDADAATQQGIAIGGFVAGGVGLAAGITLLILDQNRSSNSSRTGVTPLVGFNYVGVAGSF